MVKGKPLAVEAHREDPQVIQQQHQIAGVASNHFKAKESRLEEAENV